MNADSAAVQNESGLQSDLNRYKQAAELAYRYAKTKAEDQTTSGDLPFEEDNKKLTQDKETL